MNQKAHNKPGKIVINNLKYHFQPIFSKEVHGYGRWMYSEHPVLSPQGAVTLPHAAAVAFIPGHCKWPARCVCLDSKLLQGSQNPFWHVDKAVLLTPKGERNSFFLESLTNHLTQPISGKQDIVSFAAEKEHFLKPCRSTLDWVSQFQMIRQLLSRNFH